MFDRKAYSHDWYIKNRQKRLAQQTLRRQENRQRIWDIKSKTPCADCGIIYHPVAVDFDHIDDNKSFSIMNSYNMSWENLAKEIAKCEVVCSNCHRIRTYTRRLARAA